VVSFMPRPLYPHGKSPLYPLDRGLGWPQNRSRCCGEEKNSQLLLGFEPPIIQPLAWLYTTEVSWLLHKKGYKLKIQRNVNSSMLYATIHTYDFIIMQDCVCHEMSTVLLCSARNTTKSQPAGLWFCPSDWALSNGGGWGWGCHNSPA
jgi:hypothetical protein